MKQRLIGLLVIAVFSLMGCDSNEEASIEISVSPSEPIVFTEDYVFYIGDEEQTIPGPWFSVQIQVTNKLSPDNDDPSNSTITVTGLQYIVSYTSKDGGVKTTDPRTFTITGCTSLAEITAGETVAVGSNAVGEASQGCLRRETIYIGDLPSDFASLKFRVNLEILGWVGTTAKPIDRLNSPRVNFSVR